MTTLSPPKRILTVEDNAMVSADVRTILEAAGYDVCPDVLRAWCEAGRILSHEETAGRVAQSPSVPVAAG